MVNIFYIGCITITVLLCNLSVVLTAEEGDTCRFNSGQAGICKFLTSCPAAFEGLKQGRFPQICGFVGTQSIVCCEATSAPAPTSRPTSTSTTQRTTTTTPRVTRPTTTETPSKGKRVPGEISRAKCKEYAQYAYDREESPTLIGGPTQFSNTLECPFEKLELIVGGTLASRREFPHQALIGYETTTDIFWSCGGTLISPNFVLTAGHCLKNRELGSAKYVRIGITNQTDLTYLQQFRIVQIIQYPDYVNTKYHDIGLFRLADNAYLTPYVRPACLHTEKSIPYKHAIASGWGKIEFSGDGSKDLLKVVLEFFSLEKCNSTYRRDIIAANSQLKYGILDELMVCAGSTTEFKDTCQGDSGGPLQIYHEETKDIRCMYEIVGVTSFGKSCGLAKNVPGVYTRVSGYIKWIEDVVWP